MKLSISLLTLTMVSAMDDPFTESPLEGSRLHWMDGKYGQFNICPKGQYARGFCSSGEVSKLVTSVNAQTETWISTTSRPSFLQDPDCNYDADIYTQMGCGSFPNVTTDTSEDGRSINGWRCAKYGELESCPEGTVMVGMCGSGGSADCELYCDPAQWSAIKCAPAPKQTPVGPGRWTTSFNYGQRAQCGENQVACGLCQSGADADCQGGFWRMKCCNVGKYNVVGHWIPKNQLISPSLYSYEVGTAKTEGFTKTETWANSVTASVEGGLTVMGLAEATAKLSVTMSSQFAKSDSKYWTMSTTTTWATEFQASDAGKQVWQWVYDIESFRDKVNTLSPYLALTDYAGQPPKCVPGYATGKGDYQVCREGGYLPGFKEDSTGGTTSLRGAQTGGN